MISVAALGLFASVTLAPALPWASGFAPAGSLAFVADLDGDGYADLIRVVPSGDSFIDVSFNVEGLKAGRPVRALSNWGQDCQAIAVGNLENSQRSTIVGLFNGDTLRLAHCDIKGNFEDVPNWIKLNSSIPKPHLTFDGPTLCAWDEKSGRGVSVKGEKRVVSMHFPAGVVKAAKRPTLDGKSSSWVFQFRDGSVKEETGTSLRLIGSVKRSTNMIVADHRVYVNLPASASDKEVVNFPSSNLPECPSIWASGDIDHDGDQDLIQFRFGNEAHTANDTLIFRTITPGEIDSDHDGLSNDEELKIGSDPYRPDTAGDGILDGWKVNGFRGLDLKAMGCDPRKVDIICLISRYSDVDEKFVTDSLDKVKAYYRGLPVKNPDGSTGWNLHTVYLPAVAGEDMKKPWWENRDKFLPSKWKGVVHWMQITRGGGGQADELGDGGGCGGGGMALYATFIHEFGHQLGLPHNGFYEADGCPVYPSLMNYPYSYNLNGSINNVGYSDGRLAKMVLNEADLDEVLPLPYEKVKFLENAPYRYHLKANGATTLIDWNWNGIFGEHHVKADINYAYSTTGGRRDVVDKTQSAPWVFTHNKRAYVLYSRNGLPSDPKTDPTISAAHPGTLYLKRLKKPYEWEKTQTINYGVVTGDPTAISFGGSIVVAYPSTAGVMVQNVDDLGTEISASPAEVINPNTSLIPSLVTFNGKLWLFLWDPSSQAVTYQVIRGGVSQPQILADKSTSPVGLAVDTIKHQLIVGLTQDQDAKRLSRWQVRHYKFAKDQFIGTGMDWVEGEKGGARSHSRSVVLFDANKRHGPDGRIYYFIQGDHSKESPWACCYVSESVADKTHSGGWLTKRFYDEWTQSRSAPAAAFFGGDILYSYRWVDGGQGETDNQLQVAYRGTGIEPTPMGDFDDLTFLHDFGIRHCLMYLNR